MVVPPKHFIPPHRILPRVYSTPSTKMSHDITTSHDTSHDITNSEHLGSTRLKPEDKRELCNLLQYVPRDVIRRSRIYAFLSSKCHFKSAESLLDSQKIDKDGGREKQLSRSVPKGRLAPSRHDSGITFQRGQDYKGERGGSKSESEINDLEWVMLDGCDSSTCSSSGSSMDASAGSLDIDIGDLSITTTKGKK